MAIKEKIGDKVSRITQYLKDFHKWENYVFLFLSLFVLILGCLFLTGTLTIRDDFWLFGGHQTAFGITLTVIGALFTVYGLYPFFKPAFPEFKKISWLPFKKFVGNSIRVLMFIVIFSLLFLLYDAFITQILARIL